MDCRKLVSNITTSLHFLGAATLFLARKFRKPLLQKSETKIFKQKIFRKKLVQSQREKNFLRLEIEYDNV